MASTATRCRRRSTTRCSGSPAAPTTSSSTPRDAIGALAGLASVAEETSSWPYRHDRDLTGFIDGSENPSLIEAPGLVLVPGGRPGAGGTVLLLQKWAHDASAWESLSVAEQERVIGRTKRDSVELDDKPASSHVARTDQERFGDIFRRNMPYGTVTDHGTMFVGFASEQRPLPAMLESMAGLVSGARDALTRYTRPLTGAYYFVPSLQSLLQLSAPPGWPNSRYAEAAAPRAGSGSLAKTSRRWPLDRARAGEGAGADGGWRGRRARSSAGPVSTRARCGHPPSSWVSSRAAVKPQMKLFFKERNVDLIYSRYRRRGDLTLDESFFPVLWDESGYRTPWLAELPAL